MPASLREGSNDLEKPTQSKEQGETYVMIIDSGACNDSDDVFYRLSN